ncbi:UNVERIFIED_CONTAM: hypothetical protein K2H54_046455 [Gekko kuhli]
MCTSKPWTTALAHTTSRGAAVPVTSTAGVVWHWPLCPPPLETIARGTSRSAMAPITSVKGSHWPIGPSQKPWAMVPLEPPWPRMDALRMPTVGLWARLGDVAAALEP